MVTTITYTRCPIIPKCKHLIFSAEKKCVLLNRHTGAVVVTLCCMQESYAMSMFLLCNGKFMMSLGAAVLTFNKQYLAKLLALVTFGMQCTGCQCIIIINSSPFIVFLTCTLCDE